MVTAFQIALVLVKVQPSRAGKALVRGWAVTLKTVVVTVSTTFKIDLVLLQPAIGTGSGGWMCEKDFARVKATQAVVRQRS